MTDQPQPLAARIAAAMAGHSANISNGDGTVVCNCGATVGANPAAWREHRADTVLAVVQPDLDARDTELRRLTAELEQARPELCADCGHLKSAHYEATGDVSGCNASAAKVRSCNCWYFIPAAVSGV